MMPFQDQMAFAQTPEQFRNQLILGIRLLGFPMGEHLRKLFQKLSSPLADLIGMNAELRSDLRDRLLPLGRFKCHFCLEG
jgi:hypothetical protein